MTDDEFCTNEMLWGFASRRASKYSEDRSAHVRRGYEATAARGSAENVDSDALLEVREIGR